MRHHAARIALPSVPTRQAADTVGDIRKDLKDRSYEVIDVVLIVDDRGRYQGVADMRDVLRHDDAIALGSLIRSDWPSVTPETDRERAADAASAAGVPAVPVIGRQGQIVGCIPPTTLLDVLAKEHREDLHRLAGVLKEREGVAHSLDDPPFQRVIRRTPWLVAGLVLSSAVTAIMASFADRLQAHLAVAFFIPALVYLTDAIGTQTEAIVVRGLSLQHRPLMQLLWREAAAGGIIGGLLGLLAAAGVMIMLGDARMAAGVGLSLLVAGLLASVIGLLLPWTLSRIGADPAFGSGPIATIIQDAVTLLVYFLTMSALLG